MATILGGEKFQHFGPPEQLNTIGTSRVFAKNTDNIVCPASSVFFVVLFLFVLVFLLCVVSFVSFVLRSMALLLRPPPLWFLTLWKVKGEERRGKNGQIQHGERIQKTKNGKNKKRKSGRETTAEK